MAAPRVDEPRTLQINVSMSEREMNVLAQLANEHGRGKPSIMRSALAVYQAYVQSPAMQAAYAIDSANMLGPKMAVES